MNQLTKLLYFLSSPVKFFKENEDNEDTILKFAIFNIRLNIIIELIIIAIFIIVNMLVTDWVTIFNSNKSISANFIICYVVLLIVGLIIKPFTTTTIAWYGKPLHWTIKWITGKDDLLKAKRISVYTATFSEFLIHGYVIFLLTKSPIILGIALGIVIALLFFWQTIGIAKQYELSYIKASYIFFIPFLILIGSLGIIFLYMGINLGFENMF